MTNKTAIIIGAGSISLTLTGIGVAIWLQTDNWRMAYWVFVVSFIIGFVITYVGFYEKDEEDLRQRVQEAVKRSDEIVEGIDEDAEDIFSRREEETKALMEELKKK